MIESRNDNNLVYFDVFFQPSGCHWTKGKQFYKITAQEIVLIGKGVREPGIEEVPPLLCQKQLQKLRGTRTEDVDVNTFGNKFL